MFEVFEYSVLRRYVLKTAESFEAAKAYVRTLGVAFMEDDEDHPGCADAFTNDGRVIHIEPVGFKL